MCSRMKELVGLGDLVTPNLTEACILTGREYREEGWHRADLLAMAEEILKMGPSGVVITGVKEGAYLTNVIAERDREAAFCRSLRVGRERPGTGDVFSAIVAAEAVKGSSWLTDAAKKAGAFCQNACLKIRGVGCSGTKTEYASEEVLAELIKWK